MTFNERKKVLIIDDEPSTAVMIKHWLVELGFRFQIDTALDVESAIEKIKATRYDAALVDIVMPGIWGITVADMIHEHDPDLPLAFCSGLEIESVQVEAAKRGIPYFSKDRYLKEPGIGTLVKIIDAMANRQKK